MHHDEDLEELSFFHHENVTLHPHKNKVYECHVLVQGESDTTKAIVDTRLRKLSIHVCSFSDCRFVSFSKLYVS